MRKRDYRDYIQDILDAVREIQDFIKGMDFPTFSRDRKTINAVIRSLEVMGEAAKKIPRSLREKYPDIPWKHMSGMRDKLIHEYFGIDIEMLWKVVTEEIPPLESAIQNALLDFVEEDKGEQS